MSVVPLNSTAEVQEHCEFLYGDSQGFVYSPIKNLGGEWKQYYFEWPRQKQELFDHIESSAIKGDVYLAPAMFKRPSGQRKDIKGTNVIWTEFDGKIPNGYMLDGIPAPSRRLRSSREQNQHWYWRLDQFLTDVDKIEELNRSIAYKLMADTSAWDAPQVLRPPATLNHKAGGVPVLTVGKTDEAWAVAAFDSVELPPIVVGDIVVEDIPDTLQVVAKYKWDQEDFEFFRKPDIPHGSRSTAMMRLAFICAEMKMNDSEIYSLLFNADERWGKFKERSDRQRRLTDLINKARLKYPINVEPTDTFPIFGFESFLATDIQIEWVIRDLLQKQGYLLLSGPPGTGKTQLSLRFAINMALGKEFLGYSAGDPCTVIFFSMEMGHADLKWFIEQMAEGLSLEDKALLEQNLKLIPLGYGVMLDKKGEQRKVEQLVERLQPTGVFFDSLGSTSTEELSDETTVKKILDWNDRFRSMYDVFTWYIHHNRKAQANNKKPNKLADIYGNQYITARATTVLGVWPEGNQIEISALKMRLAKQFDPFSIKRSISGLNFEKVAPGQRLTNPKPTKEPKVDEPVVPVDDDPEPDDNGGRNHLAI